MKKLFYFLFIGILFSCSSKEEKNLNTIKTNFLTAKQQFESIDPNLVTNAVNGYKSNLKLVKKCVDSVEKDFVKNINKYKLIKKSAPTFFNIYNLSKRNIVLEEKQIEFLMYDIKNQLIDNDSITSFLKIEEKNVKKIIEDVNQLTALYQSINATNDSLYPYIKSFAEGYCNK
jgi:hypothetical protein